MSPHQGILRKAGMFSAGLKCKKPSHQRGLRMAVCINAFLVANPLLPPSSINALLSSCRYCEA